MAVAVISVREIRLVEMTPLQTIMLSRSLVLELVPYLSATFSPAQKIRNMSREERSLSLSRLFFPRVCACVRARVCVYVVTGRGGWGSFYLSVCLFFGVFPVFSFRCCRCVNVNYFTLNRCLFVSE